MAINLASKYSEKIASYFTSQSIMKGMGNNDYSFEGVKTVRVYTPLTQELRDYDRTASANRYGTPQEMQDVVQELTLGEDKSFSIAIDKGNNEEQMGVKNGMKMLRLQIDERVAPAYDKDVLAKLAANAGLSTAPTAALTKENIVETLSDAMTAMDNALVPAAGRSILLPSSKYSLLRLSSEFVGNDKLGEKALSNGQVGEFMGARVVRVPDSYLPGNVQFMIVHKKSFTAPWKINDTKVHQDPPGINGSLLEGRFIWDAFVIGARAAGIYVCGASGSKQAAPTITISGGSATVASTGADKILYTLDGSDPRYSDSAQVYASAVTMAAGETIRAVAYKTGSLASDVSEKANA